MLALVSGRLTEDCLAALQQERGWHVEQVRSVRQAARELTEESRRGVEAIVVESEPVSAEFLDQLPRLAVVACLRSEPVNVDVAAATERGIPVIYAPGRNAEAVADFTLGLCLAMLRGIALSHHGIVSGVHTERHPGKRLDRAVGDIIWRPTDPSASVPYVIYRGRQLGSIVFGIVGFGAIGRAVAHRLRGLVREIVVADPRVSAAEILDAACRPVGLAQLLALADVVSVHARSETQIIGREQLAAMRQGSYLINTARATVLDYDALADALDRGHLRGAALDVFPEEPLRASSRLIGVPGLTMTPHLAGATEEVTDRQSQILLEAVRSLYRPETTWQGVPVKNPEVRATWLADRGSTDDGSRLRPTSTSSEDTVLHQALLLPRSRPVPGAGDGECASASGGRAQQFADEKRRRRQ